MKTPRAFAVSSTTVSLACAFWACVLLTAKDGQASTFYAGNTEIVTGSSGLAFDGAGNLYAANPNAGTISETSPSGNVSTFASGLNNPTALAFDSSGNLYVANTGDNTIGKIDSSGNASVFALGFAFGDGPHLAGDNAGNIYANEPKALDKFDSSGNKSAVFGPSLNFVEGMAVGSDGGLYVGLANAGSIISPTGGLNTTAKNYPAPFTEVDGVGGMSPQPYEDSPASLGFDANGNLFALFSGLMESDQKTVVPDVLIEFGANGEDSVIGTDVGGTYFALEPAPEPGVLGLFASGGLLVAFQRRKVRSA
jgi:hypothetical protein